MASSSAAAASSAVSCGICMVITQPDELGKLDCCAHHFCYMCIATWLRRANTCPECRVRVRELTCADDASKTLCFDEDVDLDVRDEEFVDVDELDRDNWISDANVACLGDDGCKWRNGEFDALDPLQQYELQGENSSIQCDECALWYHSQCMGFRLQSDLPSEQQDWLCPRCEQREDSAANSPSLGYELDGFVVRRSAAPVAGGVAALFRDFPGLSGQASSGSGGRATTARRPSGIPPRRPQRPEAAPIPAAGTAAAPGPSRTLAGFRATPVPQRRRRLRRPAAVSSSDSDSDSSDGDDVFGASSSGGRGSSGAKRTRTKAQPQGVVSTLARSWSAETSAAAVSAQAAQLRGERAAESSEAGLKHQLANGGRAAEVLYAENLRRRQRQAALTQPEARTVMRAADRGGDDNAPAPLPRLKHKKQMPQLKQKQKMLPAAAPASTAPAAAAAAAAPPVAPVAAAAPVTALLRFLQRKAKTGQMTTAQQSALRGAATPQGDGAALCGECKLAKPTFYCATCANDGSAYTGWLCGQCCPLHSAHGPRHQPVRLENVRLCQRCNLKSAGRVCYTCQARFCFDCAAIMHDPKGAFAKHVVVGLRGAAAPDRPQRAQEPQPTRKRPAAKSAADIPLTQSLAKQPRTRPAASGAAEPARPAKVDVTKSKAWSLMAPILKQAVASGQILRDDKAKIMEAVMNKTRTHFGSIDLLSSKQCQKVENLAREYISKAEAKRKRMPTAPPMLEKHLDSVLAAAQHWTAVMVKAAPWKVGSWHILLLRTAADAPASADASTSIANASASERAELLTAARSVFASMERRMAVVFSPCGHVHCVPVLETDCKATDRVLAKAEESRLRLSLVVAREAGEVAAAGSISIEPVEGLTYEGLPPSSEPLFYEIELLKTMLGKVPRETEAGGMEGCRKVFARYFRPQDAGTAATASDAL